ncbi:MAG TPA: hypothetical protein VHO47_00325 [Candidatus Babeliales bacterium]|nr:hypothetical protein [Candidatus Babeliales bacterium]
MAWYLLYYTYGFLPIITGLDKYFDLLGDWYIYLNLAISEFLNLTPVTFMYSVGAIEIIMGLLVFIRPRIGGYIIAVWLLAICINLISMGSHAHERYGYIMRHYDIVIRDIVIAIGAYVLVLLSKELNK